jgi:hypothetical protein
MHPPYCVFLLLLGRCLRVANFEEDPVHVVLQAEPRHLAAREAPPRPLAPPTVAEKRIFRVLSVLIVEG